MEMINSESRCTACGGNLENKGAGVFVCPFCGSEYFDKERAKAERKSKKSREEEIEEEEYDEEEEEEEYDVYDIVYDAAWKYFDNDSYGVQIIEDEDDVLSKEDKAREYFNIPDDDNIIMIYDETFFGSCKAGYALTDVGLYAHYATEGDLFIDWDDFADVKIKQKDTCDLKVDKYLMTLTGNNSRDNTYEMLCDIQEEL